jgi:hypothetical protein
MVHPIFQDRLLQGRPIIFKSDAFSIQNRIIPGFCRIGKYSRDYLSQFFSYIQRMISEKVDLTNPSG